MAKFPIKFLLVPFSIFLTPLILLLIVLPVIVLRMLSIVTCKLFFPKSTKILSPISSIFTTDNFSKPRATLVLAAVVEGELVKSEVVNRINQVLSTGHYPEMRQKLKRWLGFWYWCDCPDFNLDHHLKFQKVLSPLNEVEVRKLRLEMLKQPYDITKPLWEARVCPFTSTSSNANIEPKSIVIFRIHHCVSDGYSLLNGFRDFNGGLEMKTSKPNFMVRSWRQKLIFWIRFLTLTPVELLISNLAARDRNSFKIKKFSGESHGFEADTVELETLKRIGKKFEVSVSAVIFAGLTSAIRDTLIRNKWPIPNSFHIPCALPLDMKFGQRKNLTNVMTLIPFPAPVNEPNPLIRLQKIERIFKRKKNSELALGYSLLFQFAGLISSLTRRENGCSFGSAFWTNFPGPKNQQFLFGKTLHSFRFSTDFHNDNVALGFASICFNGKVLISCKAEKNLFPESRMSKEFIEKVDEEYKFLDKYSSVDNDFV